MPQIPRWLLALIVIAVVLGAGFAILASVRSLRTTQRARKMLDSGQVQFRLHDGDKADIAAELRKAAK